MRPRPKIAEPTPGTAASVVVALLVVGCMACRGAGQAGTGPAEAALALFELGSDPQPESLAAAFEHPPPADDAAPLLDALERLAAVERPTVVDVQHPAGPQDAYVDLDATLPGGGLARYTVRLRASGDARWRATWFQGPGVEWPPPRRAGGDGLSSSAPPETAR